ncbi:MAG: hypothetical protein EZS28_007674 [Streblomastix strix]|uniref:Uncharacterized protein n=1 Tax=Streblomastix strix TaxID=222440 RepID=A0A5J4WPD7_9EUKA|nr:MAG: hypothetical protein EZS28_007674 [Streblomastix strix]
MGFLSKIANFCSMILGRVKHASQWIAPTLHKILNTIAAPVGMIHTGIGAALGAGSTLAGAVDRLSSKRGGNSAGDILQNEDYQLFIDNGNTLVNAANNQIIDGQASDFAQKIAAYVNQLQSTVGAIDSDIVGVKNELLIIQQELARKQHFRGYYQLNTEIQNLSNSADGDFAFSAESGTVWIYGSTTGLIHTLSNEEESESESEDNGTINGIQYNSSDIVPDQVSPASDAVPNVDNGACAAGISTEYARGDHQHPLQVSEQITSRDAGTGAAGTYTAYYRADHQHILNTDPTVANMPQKDTGTGNNGNLDYYARSNHAHPPNVDPTVANVPLVNATAAANGSSDFYSRNDHGILNNQHMTETLPQPNLLRLADWLQKFLCANGDTTTIDAKLSKTYNSSGGGWIRFCVFPAGASVGNPFIEFKVYSQYNAVQTFKLVPYYTVNGLKDVYGIFTAPTKISTSYLIEQGVNQLFHTHTGTGTSTTYSTYVRIESVSSFQIVVSDQSTYYTNRITEILTQDVVSTVPSGIQIPIAYYLANGGIINNMIQVNPTGRSYTTYNNGIRIGNYSNQSAIYLGCSASVINTTQSGQWEISKTDDNTLTINPSSLRQADHNVGLNINSDNSIIKFNGNELVNVGTDQTITGKKTFASVAQINPNDHDYNEGLRISRSTIGNYSGIFLGCDPNQTTGTIPYQWCIVNTPTGEFRIGVGDQILQSNQGLIISADGQTLTFNGSRSSTSASQLYPLMASLVVPLMASFIGFLL